MNQLPIIFLGLALPQVASSPASTEEEVLVTSLDNEELDSVMEEDSSRDYFVLEESSGWMEPSLHLLAIAHTVISFCCIIGYYYLKVY